MTKAQTAERKQAIEQLREWIKPGDTVYTILDNVSRSGMSRAIRVVLLECHDGQANTRHPNWAVGKALGLRHWKRNGREQDALVVGGCGMDMGFHLVYELSHVLYGARLQRDIYLKDSPTTEKGGKGQLLTRDGAPEGQVYVGGYACLGKGKCPSNYHSNHRDRITCEGTRRWDGDTEHGKRCYQPRYPSRYEPPADWPTRTIDIGDGQTINGGYLACIEYEPGEAIPVGTKDLIMREDGSALQVCPTCQGEGTIPNPEGPERFDLIHTDGYALRHRWL